MFLNENNTPGTKPVGNNQQNVAQSIVEVGDGRDSDQQVKHSGEQCPHDTTDALEGLAKHLHGESDAISIGDVVGNNTQRKQEQQDIAKTT